MLLDRPAWERALLLAGAVSAAAAVVSSSSRARSALGQGWPPFALVAGLLAIGYLAHEDGLFQRAALLLAKVPGGPERAYVVRDGTHVPTGSRELIALRPPLFDNPGTAGFFDPSSRVLFSSNFFGGLMPSHEHALSDDVASVGTDDVVAGQLPWGSVDAPWVHSMDESKLGDALDAFRRFDADVVLSTHLPPIRGTVDQHLKTISTLPSSPPTMAPDQDMLEAAMAKIAHEA